MALATNTTPGSIVLAGDLTGVANAPELRVTGVVPGTYGPVNLVVDSKGRLTSAKTSTWADIEPLMTVGSTITLGIIQVCDGLKMESDFMKLNAPDATYTTKGMVQLSHSFDNLYGVLTLNAADTDLLGGIKVGAGMSIDGNNALHREGATIATTSTTGVIKVGSGLAVDGTGNLTLNAPIATTSTTGVVKIGTGLSVDGTGNVILNAPIATSSTTGVVKIGTGLDVDGTGNVTLSGNVVYTDTPPTFTKAQRAGVMALTPGSSVSWNAQNSSVFTLTASGDFTLNNPTNLAEGSWYHIIITTTAVTTITYGSAYKFRGTKQPLTSNGVSMLSCYCADNSTLFCIMQPDFV